MNLKLPGSLFLAGAGQMGGALLSGWMEQGIDLSLVTVLDPAPSGAAALLQDETITLNPDLEEVVKPAVIVIAVKPQIMDKVLLSLTPVIHAECVILSIAAGKTIASIAAHMGETTAIVRAMPNTPAAIGRGMTVMSANAHVTPAQARTCEELMSAVGEVDWVEDESLIDAVTAVSGSGPAYVFHLVECMAAAGVEEGLPEELSMRLARQTVIGAGELLRLSSEEAGSLRKNVTSPGGTTEAALKILRGKQGLQELMNKAVATATKRSRELSG